MYSPQFDYYRAKSVEEAGALLKQHPGAKLLAGGHTLIPLLKLRLASPPALIDIGRIAALKGVEAKGGVVRIGALTTHAEIASSQVVREQCPALAEAAGHVGDPAVRNRGTIGGNVAHADPASDLPTVLAALGARFVVTNSGGQQTIPVEQFFTGLMSTALGEGDLLTAIEVPAQRRRSGQRVREVRTPGVALRRHRRRGGAGRQRGNVPVGRSRHRRTVAAAGARRGRRAPPDRTGTLGRHHGGCRCRRRRRSRRRHHRRPVRVGRVSESDGAGLGEEGARRRGRPRPLTITRCRGSIDELQALLERQLYIADRGLATSIFLALKLKRPLLLEGEAGVGKTEVAKVLSAAFDVAPDPPAVLRRSRRQPGGLRMELREAAARDPVDGGVGRGRPAVRRPRAVRRALPPEAPATAGARRRRLAAPGAAHRRARSRGRGVRGVSAGIPRRFPDHDPRARNDSHG